MVIYEKEINLVAYIFPSTSGSGKEIVICNDDLKEENLRIPFEKEISLEKIRRKIIEYYNLDNVKINLRIYE